MEKKFLMHLLYMALIDIRARSHRKRDRRNFELSNFLHNVPLSLLSENSEEKARESYKILFENVKGKDFENWFELAKEAFLAKYPEYQISN